MYLGMTRRSTRAEVFKYIGSGEYWCNHIRMHGNDIDTYILKYLDGTQRQACIDYCTGFSKRHNIVRSKHWANLMPEYGINGGPGFAGRKHSEESKQKISASNTIAMNLPDTKKKMSESQKGN
eukprot:278382_1